MTRSAAAETDSSVRINCALTVWRNVPKAKSVQMTVRETLKSFIFIWYTVNNLAQLKVTFLQILADLVQREPSTTRVLKSANPGAPGELSDGDDHILLWL